MCGHLCTLCACVCVCCRLRTIVFVLVRACGSTSACAWETVCVFADSMCLVCVRVCLCVYALERKRQTMQFLFSLCYDLSVCLSVERLLCLLVTFIIQSIHQERGNEPYLLSSSSQSFCSVFQTDSLTLKCLKNKTRYSNTLPGEA